MINKQLNKTTELLILHIAGVEQMLDEQQVKELMCKVQLESTIAITGYHNATELGKRFSTLISAQKVNKLLEGLGYQVKSEGKWEITSKGLIYVKCIPYARKRSENKWEIGYTIKWHERIIEVLEGLLAEEKVA